MASPSDGNVPYHTASKPDLPLVNPPRGPATMDINPVCVLNLVPSKVLNEPAVVVRHEYVNASMARLNGWADGDWERKSCSTSSPNVATSTNAVASPAKAVPFHTTSKPHLPIVSPPLGIALMDYNPVAVHNLVTGENGEDNVLVYKYDNVSLAKLHGWATGDWIRQGEQPGAPISTVPAAPQPVALPIKQTD
eukprot:GHVT01088078.1.p1 GENE.GHVT01088078.1~~GHVT01088078.1.p1  ORF type:complete len:193 (-),score=27.57 GHVT01088078.1:880-1458(-)